jgi:hypothetical protein
MNAPLVSEYDDQYESGSGGGDKFFRSGACRRPRMGERVDPAVAILM